MLILNSGGTLNKRYNFINGELEVPMDNNAIDKILQNVEFKYDIAGIIFKDSLQMDINDRKMLANIIMQSKDDTFIIIHGTDTMNKSAEFLSEIFNDRKIILTGAMKPFEIDNIESSLNLGMAIGFAKAIHSNGIYICMNGNIELHNKITKNTNLGKFELVK
ncbi:asparaginase domain-containing protein [Sulfurimonas sp.]|uniref:asparaginase domain-containing protein n=1 Tax=Sulfurimonas sp. TaxID=2022749 RepID=UPI002AB0DA5F|nr:asparaginase domain-containing protein [Sulfurimonas sp.]